MIERAAARVRAAHRAVHQPAPALHARADQPRRRARSTPSGSSTTYDDIAPYLDLVDAPARRTALSFFEVLTAMAFRRRSPTRRSTSRWSRSASAAPGTPPTSPTRRSPWSRRSALDHTELPRRTTVEQIAGEKAGIIKPGAHGVLAQQPAEAAEVLLRRVASRSTRRWPARAWSSASLAATLAVGGQLLDAAAASAATYDEVFLPLLRRAPGAQRRRARSPRSRRSSAAGRGAALDLDIVRAASPR